MDRGAKSVPPPPPSSARRRAGAETAGFVGRTEELAQIRDHFADGGRVVTVLGPGGAGKTSLVKRYAAEAHPDVDAVWFCDLAPATSLEDVLRVVAHALGLSLTLGFTADDVIVEIGHALAQAGRAILILDTFERVVAHADTAVDRWIELAPEVLVLITSRQPLDLSVEIRLELPPLSEDDALTLFERRAAGVRPGFELGAGDRDTAREIVRRLDGIPLAIELAAARMVVLAPRQILAWLSRRFDLLRSVHRRGPPRHATLDRTIEWSWALLSPAEQDALARCSVFRGGFHVDGAENVIAMRDSGAPMVLDLLQALREKSLLHTSTTADVPGVRFGMYESILAYAGARLDALGYRAEVEERHARYFVTEGEKWASWLSGPDWRGGVRWLTLELENLLDIARRPGTAPEYRVRAILCVDPLLTWRGPFETQISLLASAAEDLADLRDPSLRVRLLLARGEAARVRGDLEHALSDLQRALDVARAEGLTALQMRGYVALLRAQFEAWRLDEARRLIPEALQAARSIGALSALAQILVWRSLCLDDPPGEEGWREALRLLPEIPNQRDGTLVMLAIGNQRRNSGYLDEARRWFERALVSARSLGDHRIATLALHALGSACLAAGELDQAEVSFTEALEAFEHIGHGWRRSLAATYLGITLLNKGSLAKARGFLDQGLDLARRLRAGTIAEVLPLVHLAMIEATGGRIERAEDMLHAVRAAAPDPDLEAQLGFAAGVVEVARARRAAAEGDHRQASLLRGAAERRLALVSTPPRFGTLISIGILRAALAQAGDRPITVEPPAIAIPDEPAESVDLEVGPECAWFRVRGSERIDLRTRSRMRRLLATLCAMRTSRPGEPIDPQELIAAAWPQERLIPSAAKNRLHNAIATLRSLGLKGLLLRHSDGYLLDPGSSVLVKEPV